MTPEQERHKESLLNVLAGMTDEERNGFLKANPITDREVRRAVFEHLESGRAKPAEDQHPPAQRRQHSPDNKNDGAAPNLFDDEHHREVAQVLKPVKEGFDQALKYSTGKVIGQYTLLKPIGEGGHGQVYEAESKTLRRRVAVKMLNISTPDVIRRFDRESKVLAAMDHPGIAKIHDGGVTDDGRPYLVMELIDKGLPITEYCDENLLSIRQRVELFVLVCKAVHYAHQRTVLHRDLKPANIIVAEVNKEHVPKMIDFGLAKALDRPFLDEPHVTLPGTFLGTPLYMSPEQARGDDKSDIRSDVYSLGALLYELLAGVPTIDPDLLKKAALQEAIRVIVTIQPFAMRGQSSRRDKVQI